MAADDTAVVVSLRADIKDYESALKTAVRQTERAAAAAEKAVANIGKGGSQAGINQLKRNMDGLSNSISKVESEAAGLKGIMGRLAGGGGVGNALLGGLAGGIAGGLISQIPQVIQAASQLLDVNTQIMNSLKLTGLEGDKLAQTYDSLGDSAMKNGANFQALATLYSRVGQSQKELGVNAQQVAHFVDGIATAMRVAGVSSSQAQGALLQLSQALGSGVVRGDEFNSIMEGLPTVMRAVADGLGVPLGSLKKLASDGKLTAKVFFDAFTKGQANLEAQAGKTALTIGGAWENVYTATIRLVSAFDKMTGASGKIAGVISGIGTAIGTVASGFDLMTTAIERTSKALDDLGNTVGIENLGAILGKAFETVMDPAGAGLDAAQAAIDAMTDKTSELKKASDAYVAASRRGLTDVEAEVSTVTQAVTDLIVQYSKVARGADLSALTDAWDTLQEKVKAGTATVADFDIAIAELRHAGADLELIQSLQDAQDLLKKGTGNTKEMADAAAKLAEEFMKAFGPQTTNAVDQFLQKLPQILNILGAMTGQASAFFNAFINGMGGIQPQLGPISDDVRKLIASFENFSPKAYWDVNHWRVGFGSDTFVDEMGRVQTVTKDTVVTYDQAMKDLDRRIGEFQNGIVASIGPDFWQSFSKDQQAALTSIAYNYGSLPKRIVAAIKTGDQGVVARAIAALGSDNAGANMARRQKEAALFAQGSAFGSAATGVEETTAAQEKANQADRDAARIKGELGAAIDQKVAKEQEELQFAKLLADAQEKATARGSELTDKEIAKLHELAHAYGQTQGQIAASKGATDVQGRIDALNAETAAIQAQIPAGSAVTAALDQETIAREANAEAIQVEAALKAQNISISAAESAAILKAATDHQTAKVTLEAYNKTQHQTAQDSQQLAQSIASGIGGAISGFISDLRAGKSAGEAFNNMLNRILDSLIDLAVQMLIVKPLTQALGGMFGGGGGSLFHQGGVVGSTSVPKRKVNPLLFAGAPRLHNGLMPNEFPAILQRGEIVLPKSLSKKMSGGGGGAGNTYNQNIGSIAVAVQTGPGQTVATTDQGKLLGIELERAVQVVLVRESKPGGILRRQGAP